MRSDGRRLIGPVERDGAIVYEPLGEGANLPAGLVDEQVPGRYRLRQTEGRRLFDYFNGPGSAKRFLHPPDLVLMRARKRGEQLIVLPLEAAAPPMAIIGLRACDLAAIAIQDRVFLESEFVDPHYATRRADLLVVAVQCAGAAATCFCSSMGSGPRIGGFDLGLTELLDEAGHRFVIEIGSEAGAAIADQLPLQALTPSEAEAPQRAAEAAEAAIQRELPQEGLREALLGVLESPQWGRIAERCLGCANCTMVCPTCFCTDIADLTDLEGEASRVRRWDSCFHIDFTHMHGGPARADLAARYRQWLTHKLATWHDQFGTSGCVGCGRCTTWCPAGIDLVAEATALAAKEHP